MERCNTKLNGIPIDHTWSFSDKTIKDTGYITHSYYTYPAKFIPQLAARLINSYSKKGDIVIDPFAGSGTTIIEAIVNERIGIGTDVNDIAYLISKVKTTPLSRSDLVKEYADIDSELIYRLNGKFDNYIHNALQNVPSNDRIDYWFEQSQKEKLAIIWMRILEIQDADIRDFFKVGFAQILKSCSVWMQKSVKPTRDKNKKNVEPLQQFITQTKKMLKKHFEFEKILNKDITENIDKYRIIKYGDSRELPCNDEAAQLIVTSPPYVTSYEYADLHQLPSLWFGYMSDLSLFRNKFIGSAYKEKHKVNLKSKIAENIVHQLSNKKK